MINLLPPQQKEELLQEQKYRLFLILGVLAIIFLIALSLALFSVKIYISGNVQSENILVPLELQDQEKEITSININLKNLNSFYEKYPDFTELLGRISQIIPKGIYLTSLSLSFSEKDKNFPVSLYGFSATRESLFQFKKNLESEAVFKDIDFPASNWVKPENINFSLSFKINNDNE